MQLSPVLADYLAPYCASEWRIKISKQLVLAMLRLVFYDDSIGCIVWVMNAFLYSIVLVL